MSGAGAGWGQAIASLVGEGINLWQARNQRSFNRVEAQKSRDFIEYMAKNQMQHRVADLRAAGLNPMLAYTQGGATTGSTSTAQGALAHKSEMAQMGERMANVRNLKESAKLLKEKQRTEETIQSLNMSNAGRADAEAAVKRGQAKIFSATGNVAKDAQLVYDNLQDMLYRMSQSWDPEEVGRKISKMLMDTYNGDKNQILKVMKEGINKAEKGLRGTDADVKARRNVIEAYKKAFKAMGEKASSTVKDLQNWLFN